jgi:hypothetical protein
VRGDAFNGGRDIRLQADAQRQTAANRTGKPP